MANPLKEAQKQNDIVERRWQQAYKDGNVSEMYAATQDYEANIKKQEQEIAKMDPNSKEYNKAQQNLDAQKSQKWEMDYAQRRVNYGEQKQYDIDKLQQKNDQLSRDMDKAIKKGDTQRYDQLKSQYDKNVGAQEKLCRDAKEEGYQPKETIIQQKSSGVSMDADMRDKIASKAQNGKQLTAEEQKQVEKYNQNVRKGEVDQLRYQSQKEQERMKERGVSQEEIDKKNKEDKEYIDRYERTGRL